MRTIPEHNNASFPEYVQKLTYVSLNFKVLLRIKW